MSSERFTLASLGVNRKMPLPDAKSTTQITAVAMYVPEGAAAHDPNRAHFVHRHFDTWMNFISWAKLNPVGSTITLKSKI